MNALKTKAFSGLLSVLIGMAALIFLPAWTLDYWQAWVFLAVFGASGLVIIVYFLKKDPKLLERRMSAGPIAEERTSQKIIMSISSLGFVALLVVPALDHRFGWSSVPPYAVISVFPIMLHSFGRGEQIYLQVASTMSDTEIGETYEENHRHHVGDT